jgi:hypothetical protein
MLSKRGHISWECQNRVLEGGNQLPSIKPLLLTKANGEVFEKAIEEVAEECGRRW